eukprot:TRINITY_DN529_c0_g1_i1.p1 TRINITY_DN529_c0_g1~~TRINITY_DN529_c0_g1_i1.p1  ORF type:complete len:665 (+),score=119.97 TRINITY_DN529_c0_g1_i1:13-2007(+)
MKHSDRYLILWITLLCMMIGTLHATSSYSSSSSPETFVPLWAIEFKGEMSHDRILSFADRYGCHYIGTVGVLDTVHLFSFPETERRSLGYQSFINYLYHEDGIKRTLDDIQYFDPQMPQQREKRVQPRTLNYTISDPLYSQQWHLHGTESVHVNAESAWEFGIMGQGVTIAIVDDGVASTHPDIQDNFRLDASWNYNANKNSPDPTYLYGGGGDWHGTASAGTAAARDDGSMCGVGVAPRAYLSGVAILQNNADVPDSTEAQALSHKPNLNDIYSNSWGPIRPGVGGHKNEGPGPLALRAMETCLETGRGGLGNVYVWAAGNDKSGKDNCNYDGYANLRFTILIGSTDIHGKETYYSEPCAALHAVTPGGLPSVAIKTTDLMGSMGKDSASDCTDFAGTSASCPMAAGVVALILQTNPNLSWLDVQYVIANSTIKNDPDDPDWEVNAAGRWVNHKFGFGLLDAGKAVFAARSLNKSVEELSTVVTHSEVVSPTEQSGAYICEDTISITDDFYVHHVVVSVTSSHPDVSSTTITLISPGGTKSILAEPHSDRLSSWNGWNFMSTRHWDERSVGNWVLEIKDSRSSGSLQSWTLKLYGRSLDSNIWGDLSPLPTVPEDSSDSTENFLDGDNLMSLVVIILLVGSASTIFSIIFFIVIRNIKSVETF